MRKTYLIFAICAALIFALCITTGFAQGKSNDTYPRAGYITEINESDDMVVVEDAVGFTWAFYGAEDYAVGDLVIMTMKMNDTSTILDDEISAVDYSGFYR